MAVNPIRTLKNRVTAAIDWRARESARVDEAMVRQLGSAITSQGVEFTKRIEELERRIAALENGAGSTGGEQTTRP